MESAYAERVATTNPAARWAIYVGIFIVVCLLNFLVSNLPTFLDLGVVTLAAIGGVIFGRKTVAWY